jgi:Uncharacterized protein conserved in bacteria
MISSLEADPMTTQVRTGRYRHYKGNDYRVVGLAKHSETGESMVVYFCLYGDFSMWVRPAAMFLESVDTAVGEEVPRFDYIGPMSDEEFDQARSSI